jgi:hypothetical protein
MSKHLSRRQLLGLAPDARSARRRHLARLLHAAGVRPVLEALLDVAGGRGLDETLEDFARLPAELYRAVNGDEFPQPVVMKGGRDEQLVA